jgi:CotH kinase protein/Lamin Tail Domain/Immunoglobulin I-set domain
MKIHSIALLCGLGLLLNLKAQATDDVLITEFMASNNSTLADEDGDFPDWVELFNAGTNGVNLDGWSLTDNATELTKWRFPATNLTVGAYMIVFASGKDRRVPGAPLHTSFKLNAGGQFLGLVAPDGTNVVSAYAPIYPPQVRDVSFGIITVAEAIPLITPETPASVLVPSDDSLGLNWTTYGFDDVSWIPGTNGVGFDVVQVVTDDFNVYHDYTSGDVNGTIWDGVINAANLDPGSDTAGGVLHWRNTGEGWEVPGHADGPFLYKLVSGDFDAQVEVAGVTYVTWSDGGLMARVPDLADAGPGEDYVTAMLFSSSTAAGSAQQNRLRWADDNVTGNSWTSGIYGHRFLRLERVGNTFNYYTKASAGDAWGLRETITRNDFPATLQVGLQHGTFSGNAADRQYDNFVLNIGGSGEGSLTYGSLVRTDLGEAMLGQDRVGLNASAYLRLPFAVTNAGTLGQLTLHLRYDDGLVAYLNGVEVARRNAPADPAYNSSATADRSKEEALSTEDIDLTPQLNLLRPGGNVLAIHGLNVAANDQDFLILAELEARPSVGVQTERWRYFPAPTPGAPNGGGVSVLGAVVSDTKFAPESPTDADDLSVTARVRPTFDAVTNVMLVYRVMFSNEVAVPMFDDGAHGDGAVGDGVYGAAIPADASDPGQMVRWYVTATDASGTVSRWPVFEPGLEAPEYFGTVIANPAIVTQLPVFQYFIADTNWFKLPANGPYSKDALTNASVYFAGCFYDRVRVRIRGASSVYWKFPKQSLKFDFNPGEHFVYAPDREPVTQINVNEFWTDKAYLRNAVSMDEVYRAAGVPAQEVFSLLTCLNGDLHSVAGFVEEPDERFLRRSGLDPNGALYKMYNPLAEATIRPHVAPGANPDGFGGAEKKTRQGEDFSDLQALVDGIQPTNPNRTAYLFDNVNVPEVINYFAASLLIQDWDRYPKNQFVYRDTEGTGEWQMIPWDADLSWGYQSWLSDAISATHPTFSHPLYGESDYVGPYGQWHRLADALYRTPVFREMFLRRARTLLDQILQPPGTAPDQLKLEARLDAIYAQMHTEVDADKQHWGVPFGTAQTLLEAIDAIKSFYLAPRRTHLFVTHGPPNGLIPEAQFSFPAILISDLEVNPASGNQAEEYLCLTNPNPYAVDMTGWRLEGGVTFEFRAGTVLPSQTRLYLSPDVMAFRARATGPRGGLGLFVQGNYQGQLSTRGETLRLWDADGRLVNTTNYPGAPSLAQQHLRATEIMYHPTPLLGNTNDAQAFEFIELKNIGPATLDLTGVRFVHGIAFDFSGSSMTSLEPGATVVLVKNLVAFSARYGNGFPIAGQYDGSLENRGERLQLVDASGEEILDFSYDNNWYPITDGLGFSLVTVDETAEPDAWNSRANWRAGGQFDGSPGAEESGPVSVAPMVITEALTRTDVPPPTDSIELQNPTAEPVNIGGWFLSDDFNTPKKFRVPDGTVIEAGAYHVFTEADFNPGGLGFALSSDDDEVWLFSADAAGNLTGYVHGFTFGAAEDGVTFGRYVTSDGREHFVAQATPTLGFANAGPRVGPVVISEIMYRPPDDGSKDNTAAEFIELLNVSDSTVSLFDPARPTNTWRLKGGVDLVFPTNLSLMAGEYLLLVNFDPSADPIALAAFHTQYAVPENVRILGPYAGKLNNSADRVALEKPTTPVNNAVPYVLVDEVNYRDKTPWPAGADGYGLSLQRRNDLAYGDDPANWVAAPPGANAPTIGGTAPVITNQPDGQTLFAFTDAMLSVEASGDPPLGYQWRRDGANLPEGTNSILVLRALQPGQGGDYQVLVFNAAGSALSSNATLRLLVPPVITRQPAGLMVRSNFTASLSVVAFSASGTPLDYQWRLNGMDLPDATNATLTFAHVQSGNAGDYTVAIRDAVGTTLSDPATLTVTLPPVVLQDPVSQSVVVGGDVTFSVAVAGTLPINFQWRYGSTPITNFLLNAHESYFTLPSVQANQAGSYRVVFTNIANPTGVASRTAVLTVLADTDGDGVPDAWMEQYFGHATAQAGDFSRAGDDADGDGMLNGQEYVAGTAPTDALSYLKVDWASAGLPATLEFMAVSNRTYSVEYTDALGLPWRTLSHIVARTNSHTETVIDSSATANRFYRLVTPRQP